MTYAGFQPERWFAETFSTIKEYPFPKREKEIQTNYVVLKPGNVNNSIAWSIKTTL